MCPRMGHITIELERVLGPVIANRRRKAGLTQETLAFRCDLHPTYISQLERGIKSPTVRVLCLIADALDVRPSGLLAMAERRAAKEVASASRAETTSERKQRPARKT